MVCEYVASWTRWAWARPARLRLTVEMSRAYRWQRIPRLRTEQSTVTSNTITSSSLSMERNYLLPGSGRKHDGREVRSGPHHWHLQMASTLLGLGWRGWEAARGSAGSRWSNECLQDRLLGLDRWQHVSQGSSESRHVWTWRTTRGEHPMRPVGRPRTSRKSIKVGERPDWSSEGRTCSRTATVVGAISRRNQEVWTRVGKTCSGKVIGPMSNRSNFWACRVETRGRAIVIESEFKPESMTVRITWFTVIWNNANLKLRKIETYFWLLPIVPFRTNNFWKFIINCVRLPISQLLSWLLIGSSSSMAPNMQFSRYKTQVSYHLKRRDEVTFEGRN